MFPGAESGPSGLRSVPESRHAPGLRQRPGAVEGEHGWHGFRARSKHQAACRRGAGASPRRSGAPGSAGALPPPGRAALHGGAARAHDDPDQRAHREARGVRPRLPRGVRLSRRAARRARRPLLRTRQGVREQRAVQPHLLHRGQSREAPPGAAREGHAQAEDPRRLRLPDRGRLRPLPVRHVRVGVPARAAQLGLRRVPGPPLLADRRARAGAGGSRPQDGPRLLPDARVFARGRRPPERGRLPDPAVRGRGGGDRPGARAVHEDHARRAPRPLLRVEREARDACAQARPAPRPRGGEGRPLPPVPLHGPLHERPRRVQEDPRGGRGGPDAREARGQGDGRVLGADDGRRRQLQDVPLPRAGGCGGARGAHPHLALLPRLAGQAEGEATGSARRAAATR